MAEVWGHLGGVWSLEEPLILRGVHAQKSPIFIKGKQNTVCALPQRQHEKTHPLKIKINEAAATAFIQGFSPRSGPNSALC